MEKMNLFFVGENTNKGGDTALANSVLTELIMADVANKEVCATAAWLQLRNCIAARFAANYPYLTYTTSDSVALVAIAQVGASVSTNASMLLFKEFGKKLVATQKLPPYNYAHISCSHAESARKGLYENSLIGSLSDAIPNPATDETKIWYVLKDKYSHAEIKIRNILSGQILSMQSLAINEQVNEVIIDLNTYTPGVYTYSLIVDGAMVNTKRFVVIK